MIRCTERYLAYNYAIKFDLVNMLHILITSDH